MSALIIGGGPTGLAAGMILAQQGVEVTVVERDAASPPGSVEDAWNDWQRNGVAQFRKPHTLLARGTQELHHSLPGVIRFLSDNGAHEWSGLESLPGHVDDRRPRPGDERFSSLAAHRPTYELAFARAAENMPLLDIRRGVKVDGLNTGSYVLDGVPHVDGVHTSDGENIPADLVIDASGRRSSIPALLESVGSPPLEEEKEDSKFVYYSRFYRRRTDTGLPRPYVVNLLPQGSISILFIPGDNDSWSVTVFGSAADKSLRALRNPETFERVLAAHPGAAHLAEGEPITGIETMVGISDRRRSLRNNGRTVATGVILLGDAWACTNPSLGRGLSMTLMHVNSVMPAIVDYFDDPFSVVTIWEAITEEHMAPWHEATLQLDRARTRQMDAMRLGQPPNPEELAGERAYTAAMISSPDFFRANLEMAFCLALPDEVMSRPHVQDALNESAHSLRDLPESPHPTRTELEDLLSGRS